MAIEWLVNAAGGAVASAGLALTGYIKNTKKDESFDILKALPLVIGGAIVGAVARLVGTDADLISTSAFSSVVALGIQNLIKRVWN